MNLVDLANEIGAAISEGEIRTYIGPPNSISPPCAVIVMPELITYSGTYQRGMDELTWPVLVLTGRVDDRTALSRVSKYCDGSGDESIKALIESFAYTACDSVFVATCALDVVTWQGIDYQGALFTLNIAGHGS